MSKPKRFYITTPIYYVNDSPHIGHAYTTLACDALARFKRLDGYEVKFLTGTDEHGQKVEKSAQLKGVDPQAFTDEVSLRFRALAQAMNFSNDDFIRTTEPRHKKASQALWDRLIERGHITLGAYEGWYAVRDEAFYGEDELKLGPNGEKIAPTGAPVEWVAEPSYFFNLSKWQQPLLDYYEAHPDFLAPDSRRNEVLSFVRGGLTDLSVSRTTFSWGIPVPNDPKHVMYVWLDALVNYMTAAGYPDTDGDSYQKWWPADLHVVGKDIVRFHAVYWPAFLMAADLPIPHRVYAHGWWTNEGQKISKSTGNVIDPHALIAQYGLEQTRFFLLREVPFGSDGDFSHRAMVGRMNSELANGLGNLAQRSLSMIAKNCNGMVPFHGDFTPEDQALLTMAYDLLPTLRGQYDRQAFHEALESVWVVVRAANGYMDFQAPWTLAKTDVMRMATVLWVIAETVRHIALIMQPVTPEACAKLLDQLSIPLEQRDFSAIGAKGGLVVGTALPPPHGVFPRYIEEAVSAGR